jgi:hypothetical protein
MILTEEEAKKRWCPHARIFQSNVSSLSFNRHLEIKNGNISRMLDVPPGAQCIGSKCMAWTWIDPDKPMEIDLVTSDVEPRLGRCGLCS